MGPRLEKFRTHTPPPATVPCKEILWWRCCSAHSRCSSGSYLYNDRSKTCELFPVYKMIQHQEEAEETVIQGGHSALSPPPSPADIPSQRGWLTVTAAWQIVCGLLWWILAHKSEWSSLCHFLAAQKDTSGCARCPQPSFLKWFWFATGRKSDLGIEVP